jgi:uncharacterized protein YggE
MNNKLRAVLLVVGGAFFVGDLVGAPDAAAQHEPTVRAGGVTIVEHPAAGQANSIHFHLAVSNFATNATAAHAASELAVRRVLRALAGSGVQLEAVESAGMTVVPEYAPIDPVPLRGVREDPRVIGYRAIGEIRVETTDVGRLGHLLDTARGAGAYPIRPVYVP